MQRWLLPLPEPVPLPDGWTHTEKVSDRADQHGRVDDVTVTVVVHQVQAPSSWAALQAAAVRIAVSRMPGLPVADSEPPQAAPSALRAAITVVEAVTTAESPDPPGQGTASAADLSPRSDSLMRCLRLVTDLVRGYRVTSQRPVALPTYEQLPPLIVCYSAPAVRDHITVNGHSVERTRTVGPWTGPLPVLLEHATCPTLSLGRNLRSMTPASGYGQYMWALRTGDPRFTYRERYAAALRALRTTGEYGQAVVLAVTAVEVLADWLLALLLWEDQQDPVASAPLFQEGKLLRRLTRELPQRLHGNWSTDTPGPVRTWYRDASALRHRVVHSGRTPSRAAARAALDATNALERHAMDRIVERRTHYPRVTLMIVAEAGLRRRDKWSGKIRRFAGQEAIREPNWREAFQHWHQALEQARLDLLPHLS